MKVNVNLGLSVTFVLTLTSLESVLSSSPIFQRAANQNRAASTASFGSESGPLVRRARHARRHMPPCVFLSQLADIKSRFEQWMDKNQDGRANFQEVKNFLRTMRADVTNDVVASFIARRDQNGNGEIDLIPEYIQEIVGNDYGDKAAKEWFYLHDVNGDGFVSMHLGYNKMSRTDGNYSLYPRSRCIRGGTFEPELIHLGMAVGMSRDQAEDTANGYYLPLDIDGDGQLNFSEFSQLYQEPTMPSV